MGDLVVRADIEAAVTPRDFLLMFDRDADDVAENAYIDACITGAESEVKMLTAAALPAGFNVGGTVDPAIKDHVVCMVCWRAVRFSPMALDAKAPYRQAHTDAVTFFKALTRDDNNRTVTAQTGPAEPQPVVINVTTARGEYTSPFRRVADRQDASAY